MTVRGCAPFVLTFLANVIWQGFILVCNPLPHGRADVYSDAAAVWIVPSILNLVVLYRKGVLVRWHRVGRVVALCVLSATAAHIALTAAIALCVIGDFTLHGTPKPNKSPEPTAVGAASSAVAVHVAGRRWLSFLR